MYYVCAHVSHVRMYDKMFLNKHFCTRRAVMFVVVSYKSSVGSGSSQNTWKGLNNLDEKNTPRPYPKGKSQNASLKHDGG